MKRLAILTVMALMSLAAAAAPIRYFTQSQATRTVRHLNAQNEMMIYCGYDYEIETYVLINEVWAERVNSAYYELWVFGYDAYTGEEIYMPLDLSCVWLYSAGRMYSAAQYLRFHASVRTPQLTWYVPAYNPFTRVSHHPGYRRTYHYDVHCYGWMPPVPPHGGYGPGMPPPVHPYYMRQPHEPAPRPTNTWTPGVDHPVVTAPDASRRTDAPRDATTRTTRPTGQPSGSDRRGTSTGNTTRGNGTSTGTPTRGSGTSTGTTTRGSGTSTGTTSRGNGTSTGTTSRGNSTSTGTTSRGSGSSTGTTTRGSSTTPSSSSVRSGSSTSSSRSSATTESSEKKSTGTTSRGTSTSGSTTRSSTTSGTTTRGSSTSGSTTRGTSTDSRSGARTR